MRTVAQSIALPDEEKARMVREAKGGTWYDGWRPYCVAVRCTSGLQRMVTEAYGFRCTVCGNMIGWDCVRLIESPLNPTGIAEGSALGE
jgi:hypothetical protein